MSAARAQLPDLFAGFFLYTPALVFAQDPVAGDALVQHGAELHEKE